MKYNVFFDGKAKKQFDSLHEPNKSIVLGKLHTLKSDGFSPELDIKKLKGYRHYYRLRVGSYRVLFELQEGFTIVIFAVLPRKKAY